MKVLVRSRCRGTGLAETAASLALFLPVLITIAFVVIETSYAYTIAENMNVGAALAARGLAQEYQLDPGVTTNTTEQAAVFSGIRITNMINSNSQFSIPSGSSGWNTSATPPTVTVKVKYISGGGSPALPTFPNPDPLGLGATFTISSTATYRLD